MKCILIPKHGEDIGSLLTFSSDYPKPIRMPGQVLIEVKACALAPGDIRVMKGHCDYFQEPRAFPYIPGGDVSGVVEEADATSRFKPGDRVLGMFEIPRPLDGLAEYACVKEALVEKVPESITFEQAAALTSSALSAYHTAKSYIKRNDRLLVLGGSGGVGTILLQLAKNMGASYVATTSTDENLCKSLGADRVINYKKENFWDVQEFKDHPFDCVIDLGVGRYESWKQSAKVLKMGKDGGRYVTLSGDEPHMKVHGPWTTFTFMMKLVFGRLELKI